MAHPAPSTRARACNARARTKPTGREKGSTEDVRGIIGGNRGCRGKRGTKGERGNKGKRGQKLKCHFVKEIVEAYFRLTSPAFFSNRS